MIKYAKAMRVMAAGAAVVAMLGACASSPSPSSSGATRGGMPAWYSNPSAEYPDNVYLTAIGSGDTRRAAEQDALGAMSQIFRAEVSVDMSTQERYRELVTASGSMSESDVRLTQSVDVRSNQTLMNVQFGDAATDERGRVHVIAYIERMPTAQVYVDLINKSAAQVDSFLQQARSTTDMLRRYAYMSAASVVATNNEVLRDQLRIISQASSQMVRINYNFDQLLQERTDLASQMTVGVNILGDTGDRIAGAVRQALGQERFPVAANGLMNVEGTVSMESVVLNPQYKTVRWYLNLQMVGPTGTTLVTFDKQERASGVTDDAARAFAYNDITKAIEEQFVYEVRRYFDGLVLGN